MSRWIPGFQWGPVDGYDIGGGLTPSKLSSSGKDPLFQRIDVHCDYHPFPISAVVKHHPPPARTPLLAGGSMGIFDGHVSGYNPNLTGPPVRRCGDPQHAPPMSPRQNRGPTVHLDSQVMC